MLLRRRHLLAYLVGAGVAGTLLVGPYTLRAVATTLFPVLVVSHVPFFLLPIAWGLWNLGFVRYQPAVGIAGWGALLGIVLTTGVNALLWVEGAWFPAAALLPAWAAVVYYLVWLFVIGPLNTALGVETSSG